MDVVLMVNGQDDSHEGMSLLGHSPAAGTLDFGDQSVDVQPLEQTGDSGTGVWVVLNWSCGSGKLLSDVPITEALQQVFAAHDGGEEPDVLEAGGIEAAIGSPLLANRVGQGLDLLAGGCRVLNDRQGVEVPPIGSQA